MKFVALRKWHLSSHSATTGWAKLQILRDYKTNFGKYEYPIPTCPDKSGKPLNFNSCFTGFIPIIAGKDLFHLSHNPSHLSLSPDVLKKKFNAKFAKIFGYAT